MEELINSEDVVVEVELKDDILVEETEVASNESENEATASVCTDNKVNVNGTVQQSCPHVDGIACNLAPATDYVTSERSSPVKIRFSGDKGVTAAPPISVMEFFQRTVNKFPNRTAMKVERDGNWLSWTYKEYLEDVKTVAKAFIKVGFVFKFYIIKTVEFSMTLSGGGVGDGGGGGGGGGPGRPGTACMGSGD